MVCAFAAMPPTTCPIFKHNVDGNETSTTKVVFKRDIIDSFYYLHFATFGFAVVSLYPMMM